MFCICPGFGVAATPSVSSVAGLMFMPAPGCTMFTITRPMISANVLTTSK